MADLEWQSLLDTEAKITRLRDRARRLLQRRDPSQGRELVQLIQLEAIVPELPDTTDRQVTYFNTDDQILKISRLSATVYRYTVAAAVVNGDSAPPLGRVANGWSAGWCITGTNGGTVPQGGSPASPPLAGTPFGMLPVSMFDFQWNIRYGASGNQYGVDFSSSAMLAGTDRGRGLDLSHPIVVHRGENLDFIVRPIWNYPGWPDNYVVCLTCWGYRGGQ